MNKLKDWIVNLICNRVQAGGWCGLCGVWIDYTLFLIVWPYGICEKCKSKGKIK